MFRWLQLAAALICATGGLAGPASAQPKDDAIIEMQGRQPLPPPGPRIRLFISPMGEPFRQPDGFGAWLAAADTDHDGAVMLAEFRADAQRFFKLLDTDGSGDIDGFEMQAYERERVPEIATVSVEDRPRGGGGVFGGRGRAGDGRRGAPQGGGRPDDTETGEQAPAAQPGVFKGAGRAGAARFSLLNIPQPVANCDEDGDGRVSTQEWSHAMARRFAMLDKAGAGRLTREALRPSPGGAPKARQASVTASTAGTDSDSRPPMRMGSTRSARPVASSVSTNTPQTVAGPSAGL